MISGYVAFVAFVASIPSANWMIGHVGVVCIPDGPCLLPVAPGVMAPSGVLLAGLALVLRDVVQRLLGRLWGVFAILVGAVLSAFVTPAPLAAASGVAFLLSETVDFIVYTPLQARGLVLAVAASAGVGLVVDSVVFLTLAFHSLEFLAGQCVGKAWAVAASLPVIAYTRRRLAVA
jgi:uncharacterized PurR-regulated membrane protein YhhQ (DUF165 family)